MYQMIFMTTSHIALGPHGKASGPYLSIVEIVR